MDPYKNRIIIGVDPAAGSDISIVTDPERAVTYHAQKRPVTKAAAPRAPRWPGQYLCPDKQAARSVARQVRADPTPGWMRSHRCRTPGCTKRIPMREPLCRKHMRALSNYLKDRIRLHHKSSVVMEAKKVPGYGTVRTGRYRFARLEEAGMEDMRVIAAHADMPWQAV